MERDIIMKAIGYVRVSTQEQATKGLSLESQREKIKGYCQLKDLDLTGIIEDAGISAKNLKRPGIQRVLEMVGAKEVDAVVCFKLDRIFRSTTDALNTCKEFDRQGVAFHSINESIDTKSAMGKFFFTLTAAIAEMERSVLGERTSAVLQYKKSKGEVFGTIPYGKTRKGNKLTDNKAEMKIIAEILEKKAMGLNYSEIASGLNVKGVRTRYGGQWFAQQVKNVCLKGGACHE